MSYVPPEINRPKGGILHVFRDPGADEVREGRPVVGASGKLWEQALNQAGLRRQDGNIHNTVPWKPLGNDFSAHSPEHVENGLRELDDLIGQLQPELIIAYGNEASHALVPGWPSRDGTIFGATGITERRGYLWRGRHGHKVLTTLHPAACLIFRDPSGVNGLLLTADLEQAKREAEHADLVRTERNVVVLHSNNAALEEACAEIRKAGYAACDIECTDPQTLQCIGFAPSATTAYVFVGKAMQRALELVADPEIKLVFQNGQFDAYFLKTRCGTPVAGWQDDCMIAWHALWPEIAGKKESGSKMTRKSLAFLASLYTTAPEWWKNYEGATNAEMYELNGLDCCITLEIMQKLKQEIKEMGVEEIYRHEMSMMPVLVAIQERGLLVDEQIRALITEELDSRGEKTAQRIREIAEPLLKERREKISKQKLFFGTRRCPCCNGGKSKSKACWSCAGLAKVPRKRDAVELGPCRECGGAGRFDTFEFNPASNQQKVELLYNVLGLPKRYNDGKLTVDEKTLKSLLAGAISI